MCLSTGRRSFAFFCFSYRQIGDILMLICFSFQILAFCSVLSLNYLFFVQSRGKRTNFVTWHEGSKSNSALS